MKKIIISCSMIVILLLSGISNVYAYKSYGPDIYNGIFRRGSKYIEIALYTDMPPNNAVGIVYEVEKPRRADYNYISTDVIKRIGEIYWIAGDYFYCIDVDGKKIHLSFNNGFITIHDYNGVIGYNGDYIEVSNAGPNMPPDQMWLNDSNDISILFEGRKINFTDQQPVIVDGRTLAPIRAVIEAIGGTVDWNESNKTINIVSAGEKTKIILKVGNNTMTVETPDVSLGMQKIREVSLDVPAQIINDRTMIPVRAIAEAFRLNVYWDSNINAAVITSEYVEE